jgi:Ca-activated chloride channel family protein
MSFIWINMLWLLFLIPVLVAAYLLVIRRRKKYAVRFSSISLVKEVVGTGPHIRRHIPPILFLIGLTIMIFALARPTAVVTLPSQQSTVILAIDVSGSMRADDIEPTRMEAAKSAARIFIEKQPENVEIGVVSFSGFAAVVQKPTTDRDEVITAIERLMPQRRTAVGSGIATSLQAIFAVPDPEPQSSELFPSPEPAPATEPLPRGKFAPAVIVLLTDGESNSGIHPLEAAAQASDLGVRIYTIGLGTPDGTIINVEGWSVRVRLDEESLKSIAQKTDAKYFKAGSETDLNEIYKNLSTQLVMEREKTELTAGFTALAALFSIMAGLLSLLWFHRLL